MKNGARRHFPVNKSVESLAIHPASSRFCIVIADFIDFSMDFIVIADPKVTKNHEKVKKWYIKKWNFPNASTFVLVCLGMPPARPRRLYVPLTILYDPARACATRCTMPLEELPPRRCRGVGGEVRHVKILKCDEKIMRNQKNHKTWKFPSIFNFF